MLKLDHIAVIASSLEVGRAYVRDRLRVDVPLGGQHPMMGTHNRLMRIGEEEYFEIIAINFDAPSPDRPRWFGLDERHYNEKPELHWIVGTDDITTSLRNTPAEAGEATPMTRGDLEWQISIARDGRLPLDGAFPSLIEWGTVPHPADRMEDLKCSLVELAIQHPKADKIKAFLREQLNDPRVRVEYGHTPQMMAEFDTPSGRHRLD